MSEPKAIFRSAREYRQMRKRGHEWVSPTGLVVRVRRLDMTDHATINQFPAHLRKIIYDSIEASTKLGMRDDMTVDPFDGMSGEETMKATTEISEAMVRLAWIEPRIVDTVDPENDENELTIDEVESIDRLHFMTWIMNGYEVEAQALAPFPERSSAGVGTGPSVPEVRGMAERTNATPVEGDIRRDGV